MIIYYHPGYNLIGFTYAGSKLIKIEETNVFIPLTKEWVKL